MFAVVLNRKAAMTIAEIGRRRPRVSGAQRHLEFGLRQPGVGDSQAKQRFGRGICTHAHQIQRFAGANDPLEIRVAVDQCPKARDGVLGLRPSLEIHPRNADELVTQAHQVVERQDPCQIKPGA
jgi:hypothetical protein